jgi:hypothetical protein
MAFGTELCASKKKLLLYSLDDISGNFDFEFFAFHFLVFDGG